MKGGIFMENEFLLDPLWNLEAAEANLCDDIDFLHCVEERFFTYPSEQETAQYLIWQLGAMLRTVRKSMESTQKTMKKCINTIYDEKRKVNSK